MSLPTEAAFARRGLWPGPFPGQLLFCR